MFSKALFKQSCKANGTMWLIITIANCFMLACVMLISGSGNITAMKNGIQDTIITGEIDSSLEKRSINYYNISTNALEKLDELLNVGLTEGSPYYYLFSHWYDNKPIKTDETEEEYQQKLVVWKKDMPVAKNETSINFYNSYNAWIEAEPIPEDFDTNEEYLTKHTEWEAKSVVNETGFATSIASTSFEHLETYLQQVMIKLDSSYTSDSMEYKEILGVVMIIINPLNKFNEVYLKYHETVPVTYDFESLATAFANGTSDEYIKSDKRVQYRKSRANQGSAIAIAYIMSQDATINALVNNLVEYGITKEKYLGFGYDFKKVKTIGEKAIISYDARYQYALDIINSDYASGKYETEEEYNNAVDTMKQSLLNDISGTLLASLPQEVSKGLAEIGKLDMYSLIVATVFFKMAGLLLPIIYMIMAANNLICGQVDSGSMAYVLSTSTKRRQVTFTQGTFLVISLFLMYVCMTITSLICLSTLDLSIIKLTYSDLLLLNLGGFLVLFTLSGVCFFASSVYNRTKYSMSIGGGLSMFALVSTMLGLFGSNIMPSMIRMDALNYFNYVSIITLFDVVSIVDGTMSYLWKFVILLIVGCIGYIVGSVIFRKKDLPL